MSNRTAAESESNLSELLDRVIDGEWLVITRDGKPVAELKLMLRGAVRHGALQSAGGAEDEFLKALRAIPQHIKDAAAVQVRAVRDEDDA
jgi:antitoxin (DNA-binding transcriptional repressor) of toxin-antitoxin stability system